MYQVLRPSLPVLVAVLAAACQPAATADRAAAPAAVADRIVEGDTLEPVVITDTVPGDSDDPAIWIAPGGTDARILGTDKGDVTGGVYQFDLAGHIDSRRSVRPMQRSNNVDIRQRVPLGRDSMDVAVVTERRRMMLRVFRLPDMRPLDQGGLPVFDGDTTREPMGVALYRRPRDGALFAIVGGKSGPTEGYLWQYRLEGDAVRGLRATRVRAFGRYSGRKEIEAIAVDDALGYVYYSDEGVGVRKYHADPDSGSTELALFATTGVADDHEGLAIYPTGPATGYILLSDQGANRLQLFTREGAPGAPHVHGRVASIPVRAQETDGLEVTAMPLPGFPEGLLVMMSNRGAFHYYDWRDVARLLPSRAP